MKTTWALRQAGFGIGAAVFFLLLNRLGYVPESRLDFVRDCSQMMCILLAFALADLTFSVFIVTRHFRACGVPHGGWRHVLWPFLCGKDLQSEILPSVAEELERARKAHREKQERELAALAAPEDEEADESDDD